MIRVRKASSEQHLAPRSRLNPNDGYSSYNSPGKAPPRSSLQAALDEYNPTNTILTTSASSFSKPSDQKISGGMRYLNLRVAVPADIVPEDVAGYVQSSLRAQQKQQQEDDDFKIETGLLRQRTSETFSSLQTISGNSIDRLYQKPSSFVPITPTPTRNLTLDQPNYHGSSSPFTPLKPMSLYGKSSPAPSVMTLDTADMTDFSMRSTLSPSAASFSSRISSPPPGMMIASPPPLFKKQELQRPSSTNSFTSLLSSSSRPVTPVYLRPTEDRDDDRLDNSSGVFGRANVPTTTSYQKSSMTNMSGRKLPSTKLLSTIPNSSSVSGGEEEESVRNCRIKTEMCMHYENGNPCPFGENCTYAHGEEELQMTKLIDLHEAGLVDVDTYRIKPCLTWVSTGSCPFGKRCTGIHDPRVAGTQSSWLPHTETQGNTIATDINVETMHQKRLNAILYNNPFGLEELSPLQIDNVRSNLNYLNHQWETLYNLVTDTEQTKSSDGFTLDTKQQRRFGRHQQQIHPIVKLQIALKIREESSSDWFYKYRPQHFIYGEFCMVLSKRAFRVTNQKNNGKSRFRGQKMNSSNIDNCGEVAEIPLSTYNPDQKNHILVREIAFGPDSDPSVRGVALWFHIDEDEVSECTAHHAKRFRWKRGIKKNDGSKKNAKKGASTSVFDSPTHLESFPMIRPHDPDSYELTTDVMKHRLAVLKTERISNMKERYEALQKLEVQKMALQNRFKNQQRHWLAWAWPINVGREHVDKSTPVPPVDAQYMVPDKNIPLRFLTEDESEDLLLRSCMMVETDKTVKLGTNVAKIWDSFVNTNFNRNKGIANTSRRTSLSCRRLRIFYHLASGCPVDLTDRTLPHIKRTYVDSVCSVNKSKTKRNKVVDSNNSIVDRQQERCWKSLLLPTNAETAVSLDDDGNGICFKSEWDIVREHFSNSRSKKVLSIIQQQ